MDQNNNEYTRTKKQIFKGSKKESTRKYKQRKLDHIRDEFFQHGFTRRIQKSKVAEAGLFLPLAPKFQASASPEVPIPMPDLIPFVNDNPSTPAPMYMFGWSNSDGNASPNPDAQISDQAAQVILSQGPDSGSLVPLSKQVAYSWPTTLSSHHGGGAEIPSQMIYYLPHHSYNIHHQDFDGSNYQYREQPVSENLYSTGPDISVPCNPLAMNHQVTHLQRVHDNTIYDSMVETSSNPYYSDMSSTSHSTYF
ncbi:hypothetical protein CPB84DRAFT_1750178 [Gymnopilus junonius]|uniref:Uncharacterized protein n=1 Tax=Gymnopilus junonius TaxID=109634 RepID=A0A9P5NEB9_GYMJU|nr:hypothetical protein CPB84DRAFT_1750178 [Gymnopilus junonius]